MAINFNFFAKKNAALLGLGLDIEHGVMSVKWVNPLLQRKQEHTADKQCWHQNPHHLSDKNIPHLLIRDHKLNNRESVKHSYNHQIPTFILKETQLMSLSVCA